MVKVVTEKAEEKLEAKTVRDAIIIYNMVVRLSEQDDRAPLCLENVEKETLKLQETAPHLLLGMSVNDYARRLYDTLKGAA